MKRTNSFARFFVNNRRLLLFLLLPIVGSACGMMFYAPLQATLSEKWWGLLSPTMISGGAQGVFLEWFSVCFEPFCLLLLLFLCGLSACGAPIVFLVPLFWGIGMGLKAGLCAQNGFGGWLVLAVIVLPSAVMELVALLMACSESLRMTLQMAVQVLPHSARCGGLWQQFRLYCVRFLLLLLLVLGAGALDVLLRLLLGRYLL